jgi:hypothetical protein
MTLNNSDKSNYLIGILIFIVKERKIKKADEKVIHRLTEELGMNHYFLDNSIDEIRGHKYIIEEPPKFSHKEIAEAFIKDAIRLAFSDHLLQLDELEWLSKAALKNKLPGQLPFNEIKYFLKKNQFDKNSLFEIQKYT